MGQSQSYAEEQGMKQGMFTPSGGIKYADHADQPAVDRFQ